MRFVPQQRTPVQSPFLSLHSLNFPDVPITKPEISIPDPLLSHHGNALNPEFVEFVGKSISTVFIAFMSFQLIQLLWGKKKHVIYTSTPVLQRVKTCLVALEVILLVWFWSATTNDYFIYEIVAVGVAFLVHLFEFRRSAIPVASLLLFWLITSLFSIGVFVQDSVSVHKLFSDDTLTYALESVILLNKLVIFILEVGFYVAGFETDHEKYMDTVNLFSSITFFYLQPLINKIYATNDVGMKDLPDILDELSTDATKHKILTHWNKELAKKPSWISKLWSFITRRRKEKATPSLFKSIFFAFSSYFTTSFSLKIIETTLQFSQPFVLKQFISFFSLYFYADQENKPPIIIGYSWAALMFTISVCNFITFNQSFSYQYKLGFGITSGLTTVIYEKALRLSPQSRKNKPTGDIINNITMDIDIIFWFCWQLGDFLAGPLRLGVCLVSLYKLFGHATWAGVITAVIVIPFATYVNSTMSKSYTQLMKDKDDRTSLITEILNSAKNIKLYSWEKPMLTRLNSIRNDRELHNIKKIGVVSALSQFLWSCIPFFISCATYAAFAMAGGNLTPEIVFPALALFDLLSEPMLLIPNFIISIIEVTTSLKRIGELLVMDELDDNQGGCVKRQDNLDFVGDSVIVKDATFIWNNSEDAAAQYKDEESEVQTKSNVALSNISFNAKKGKLTCIVGKVGAGKSTLIKAILGDIPLKIPQFSEDSNAVRPSVETFGSIAYCPQNPWILNGSVKENILFGHRYDAKFYQATIKACELVSDFKSLPDGDRTIVGEKGISLSGGQKARISLARAVYSRADIYLLDDVLSAVDAHVGKNLIKQVLSEDGIIGDRTKVLATNSVHVLHEASDIYLIRQGCIVEHGDYDKVMSDNGELAKLIQDYGRKDEEEPEETASEEAIVDDDDEEEVPSDHEIAAFHGQDIEQVVKEQLRRASRVSFSHVYEDDEIDVSTPLKTSHELETSRKGSVPWEVFKQYIIACDYKYFSFYLGCTLATLLVTVGEKYLLSYWSNINAENGTTVDAGLYLGVYASLGVVAGFLTYIGALIIWSYCIVKGAAYFHNKMAHSVLRSPMSFFDTTPVGRILNRFTEDIGKIDMNLPWLLIGFVTTALNGIITFGIIVSTLPVMLFVISGLLVVYNYFRVIFIPTTRELKRLESVAKSPVLATIQETINGVDTIKAFTQRDRFVFKSKKLIDDKTLIGVVIQNSNRWLSMRLQSVSSTIMFASALLAVVTLGGKHPIIPSVLGFIMTYALTITYILNALVRYWAEMQGDGVAVERIIEYCDLPSEAPMIIESNRPDPSWPSKGVIKFNDYSTAYRAHLDPVLKHLNITIQPQEKVGIVGRTGAGKSSLSMALFRIIEATEGSIEIDGVNTSQIGLYDLRHHLTIIPQEAHTFRASVRENLDPFGEYTDDKLWRVLELAHLKQHVESMVTEPSEEEKKKKKKEEELVRKVGLDAMIEEGGSNLSSGQKQLLCLARALLNDTSKILVLDEATAAVDFQTDKIIQETIRSEFVDKTILTIAHRIDTIMDSDKILVLDKGVVAEFDTPANLLKNESSIFYSLCKEGKYI
ncbi:MRP-like transporter [Spathaspora passalidarum NRRL Y-27907]|uniref:MRP-like transporter n=1 Tax=Spathaspora passalidarum (strain NRRL Y-27907 / 11-Y1) TaxID=619300 RepID=G3ATH4_SPAPN|nr:MRP-like transporter [Spathaspora passalidarum NRRL Y-27907]EGW30937.1 MRP-like transporter [Spathaspora passalidarum NRRL Y-27907]